MIQKCEHCGSKVSGPPGSVFPCPFCGYAVFVKRPKAPLWMRMNPRAFVSRHLGSFWSVFPLVVVIVVVAVGWLWMASMIGPPQQTGYVASESRADDSTPPARSPSRDRRASLIVVEAPKPKRQPVVYNTAATPPEEPDLEPEPSEYDQPPLRGSEPPPPPPEPEAAVLSSEELQKVRQQIRAVIAEEEQALEPVGDVKSETNALIRRRMDDQLDTLEKAYAESDRLVKAKKKQRKERLRQAKAEVDRIWREMAHVGKFGTPFEQKRIHELAQQGRAAQREVRRIINLNKREAKADGKVIAQAMAAPIQAMANSELENEWITSFEMKENIAYIDPGLWSVMPRETKKRFVRLVGEYFRAENGVAHFPAKFVFTGTKTRAAVYSPGVGPKVLIESVDADGTIHK